MFGLLLFSGQTFMAQVLLELESRTTLYVETDGQTLLTQAEYADRYSRDNSFQASNAVTVAIRHLNAKATVSDTRQKATPKSLSKTRGPIVQISLTFSRPIFDVAFGIFTEADREAIDKILAKYKQWKAGSKTSQDGTELRRPLPEKMAWPVAAVANNSVTLSEQPLLFLQNPAGEVFLLFDKDKAFPGGMEKVAAAAGGTVSGDRSTNVDHWMSETDLLLLEAVLKKVDSILKENQATIKNLN